MNQFFTAFFMCLGMFTILPTPKTEWNNGLRMYSTACLPFVGLVIGVIWWLLAVLAAWLLPSGLAAAVTAAVPFVITGFMHLDGFMDAGDALLSWRDQETRVKILKDVHVGSFSVVLLALVMMFQFAACTSVKSLPALILIPVLSRACSAFCVLTLPKLGHSEYADEEEVPRALIQEVKVMAIVALVLLLLLGGLRGLLSGFAVLGGYVLAMRWCLKSLGGVSGDLAGFALTVAELCGLIMLSIV